MTWFKEQKQKATDYLFDHPHLRKGLDWSWKLFITVTSCFIFAWGFRAFINPNESLAIQFVYQSKASQFAAYDSIESATNYIQSAGVTHFVSGGASGTSQMLIKFAEIFPGDFSHWVLGNEKIIISALYFILNVPLIILSWFKISKQFTVFTLINVGFVSLFQAIIPDSWIYNVINLYDDMLARAIFGGICTGIASGGAMMINTSAGGTDIISFFIAEKKGTMAGKFSFLINGTIIVLYVLFACISHATNPSVNPQENNETIRYMLYTFIYLFVSINVLDFLNTKNKKQELQIFTSDESLPQVLIHAFPHSATIVDAKGAFTGKRRLMIHMVVSKSETKKATSIVMKADPLAFVTVTNLSQVYGRFYVRPIE